MVGRDIHRVRPFGSIAFWNIAWFASACPTHLCLFDAPTPFIQSRWVSVAASDGRHLVFPFSDPVRPHAPTMYGNTGHTNALFKRNRSCSLTCRIRTQTDHVEWKVVITSIFRRNRSLMSPSRKPRFLVILCIYIASLGKMWLAGGQLGRHLCN